MEYHRDYPWLSNPGVHPTTVYIEDLEVVASTEEDSLVYLEDIPYLGWGVRLLGYTPNYVCAYNVSMLFCDEEHFGFYLVHDSLFPPIWSCVWSYFLFTFWWADFSLHFPLPIIFFAFLLLQGLAHFGPLLCGFLTLS